jgi:vancomycin resistance protein YoaR
MIKVYMFIIIMGIIGSVGYGGYIYYKDTQARIQTLAENSAKLEQAAKIQKETIDTMVADRERMAKLNNGLQKELQTAERYGDQLRNTLQKHNLTHMANKRPSHIEKKMQNATNRLWDCLADVTNPDGVWNDAGTKSDNCNKNSANTGSNSSKTKTSPTK